METVIFALKFAGLFVGIVSTVIVGAVAIACAVVALNERRNQNEIMRRERRAARRDRILRKG